MTLKPLTHLLWIDLETTALPKGNDYSDVHILEVGAILTDLSLNKIEGYTEVVGMNQAIADSLRGNDYVRNMHKESGLIQDSIQSNITLADIEHELLGLLDDHNVEVGRVALAGSGVTAFDFNVIKEHMPTLAEALVYFSYDIGIFRRMWKSLAPRDIVNPSLNKHGDEKVHRAMADIEDHLDEAKNYQAAILTFLPPF